MSYFPTFLIFIEEKLFKTINLNMLIEYKALIVGSHFFRGVSLQIFLCAILMSIPHVHVLNFDFLLFKK